MKLPLVDIEECKLLAGPGFMDINGGVLNPGAVIDNKSLIVLARGERYPIPKMKTDTQKYLSSYVPLLFQFNQESELQESKELALHNFPDTEGYRLDDGKLFRFQDQIYANQTLVEVSTESQTDPWGPGMRVIQIISKLELENLCLDFIGRVELDFEVSRIEKNWVYFEHEDELYLLYMFSPYRLLKAVNWPELEFKTITNKKINLELKDGFKDDFISLSTNPIVYDDKHFLLLIHKKDDPYLPFSPYINWAILIEKHSLMPVKISSRPLFKGGISMMYVGSVVPLGNDFVFFLGDGISNFSSVKVTRKRLDANFITI